MLGLPETAYALPWKALMSEHAWNTWHVYDDAFTSLHKQLAGSSKETARSSTVVSKYETHLVTVLEDTDGGGSHTITSRGLALALARVLLLLPLLALLLPL